MQDGIEENPRMRLKAAMVRGEFGRKVDEISGQKLYSCYQCGNCSSGCPLSAEMDYLPNVVIRLAMLGQEDLLLPSRTIYVCSSCQQCTVRCPKGIDIQAVMDALKQIAMDAGVDHFGPDQIPPELAAEVPQPGLVSVYRKLST